LGALRPEPPMTLDELRRGVHVAHDVVIERAIEVGETVDITAEVVDVGRRATGATQTLLLHARDVAGGTVWRTTHTSLFLGVDVLGAPGWSTTPVRPSAARSSDGEAENVIAERRSFIRPVDAHVYSECARIWNPIHTDRQVALAAGLTDIILHGTANLAHAVSLIVSTLSEMYVSESWRRSAIWAPTSVPIAAMNTRNIASTPKRINAVARPRCHPRRASRFTPGSMARARNAAMATSTKRPLSLVQMNRTATAPRNPLQKTMTAGTTQRGRRRSPDEVTGSSSFSTDTLGA